MSNYRDDTQETIVISDALWTGSRTVAEEVLRITASVVFGMGAMAADAVTISDEVIDRRIHIVTDSVSISDSAVGAARVAERMTDVLHATDTAPGKLRVVHEDALTVADEVFDHAGAVLTDAAVIADEVIDARRASQIVADQLRVKDKTWQPARQLIEDHLTVAAGATGHLRATVLLTDSLAAADEVLDGRDSAPAVLEDATRVSDDTWGVLAARDAVGDMAVIEDTVIQPGLATGLVWTAPTSNWAMSRYLPETAQQLAVIGGAVHAVTDAGVFVLDGDGPTSAEVTTGLLDVGTGHLALPEAAYIEYELEGTASMTVNQPQSGAMQSWTYSLPAELAGTLTNGRFVFGRGLRGRHFSFTLRLDGTRGYINDWQTTFAKSNRRI